MPDDAFPAPLTDQLTDEFGHLLPSSLIDRAVEAAQAVLRRSGQLPPSA